MPPLSTEVLCAIAHIQHSYSLLSLSLALLLLHEDYVLRGARFRLRATAEPCTYDSSRRFDPDDWSEPNFQRDFRFTKAEFYELLPLLHLDEAVLRFRYNTPAHVRLGLILYRVAFPRRMNDMLDIFGHSPSWISIVATDVVQFLAERWTTKLAWNPDFLTRRRVRQYTRVLETAGASRVWGFLDGTLYHVGRPEKNQQDNYSGHHRQHGLLFQGLLTPDGLMASLMGPASGRHTDVYLLREFRLIERLRELWTGCPQSEIAYVYADKGYRCDFGLMASFRKPPLGHLTAQETRFNWRMSRLRQDIENGFGVGKNLWKVAYSPTQNSIGKTDVTAWWTVAIMLMNCHNCLRPNQISQRRQCRPPSLVEYLNYY